jgi:chromosome segregation ATPase
VDDNQVTLTNLVMPQLEADRNTPPEHGEVSPQATVSEIEQTIERVGARYVDDLRMLSAEFGRFYDAKLVAKDEQIADLQLRLEQAERERDTLAGRLQELKHTGERYVTDLRALSAELSRRVEDAERERTALEPRLQVGGS